MKNFLAKTTTIWGMIILGLVISVAAFVQSARANTIHVTADYFGTEPPAPPPTFPCNLEYLEDAVLVWNSTGGVPTFNTGTLNGHPATLVIDAKGVKKIVIKPLNHSSDFYSLSIVDIADRQPDYLITQVGQTSTISRKDGERFDREKMQIAIELVGITSDFEPLDPDFHFIQVYEVACYTK